MEVKFGSLGCYLGGFGAISSVKCFPVFFFFIVKCFPIMVVMFDFSGVERKMVHPT